MLDQPGQTVFQSEAVQRVVGLLIGHREALQKMDVAVTRERCNTVVSANDISFAAIVQKILVIKCPDLLAAQ